MVRAGVAAATSAQEVGAIWPCQCRESQSDGLSSLAIQRTRVLIPVAIHKAHQRLQTQLSEKTDDRPFSKAEVTLRLSHKNKCF